MGVINCQKRLGGININDDEWANCPVCGTSLKSKNLDGHFNKVHGGLSEKEIKELSKLLEAKKGKCGIKRAEARIELERKRRKKGDIIIISVVGIITVAILGGYYYYTNLPAGGEKKEWVWDKPPELAAETTAVADEIRISISEVNDSKAHFYSYNSRGLTIRYFVLKSSDGVIRAAFDTCDVCYEAKKGYHQEGDEMVCNSCGRRFPSVKINVEKGGCNTAPLDRTVDGNDLVIKISDLESGRWYFG